MKRSLNIFTIFIYLHFNDCIYFKAIMIVLRSLYLAQPFPDEVTGECILILGGYNRQLLWYPAVDWGKYMKLFPPDKSV